MTEPQQLSFLQHAKTDLFLIPTYLHTQPLDWGRYSPENEFERQCERYKDRQLDRQLDRQQIFSDETSSGYLAKWVRACVCGVCVWCLCAFVFVYWRVRCRGRKRVYMCGLHCMCTVGMSM